MKSLNDLDLKLGGRSHSDRPIKLEELFLNADLLESIPEEELILDKGVSINKSKKDLDAGRESASEEENDVEIIHGIKEKTPLAPKGKLPRNASAPDLQKVIFAIVTKIFYSIMNS